MRVGIEDAASGGISFEEAVGGRYNECQITGGVVRQGRPENPGKMLSLQRTAVPARHRSRTRKKRLMVVIGLMSCP